MDSSQQERGSSLISQTLGDATRHPFQTVIILLFVTGVITRIITGLQYRSTVSKQPLNNSPLTVPILPYWIPWLGHGLNFAFGGASFLTAATHSLGTNGSIYALWMANSKHNVVTVPSVAKQVLIDRNSPITMEPIILHVMKNFWADRGSVTSLDPAELWGNIHTVLSIMLRESFVTTAIVKTVDMVQSSTWNLISGAASPVDHSIWERQANAEVISAGQGTDSFVAEASLFPLLRYFVGQLATTAFFGQDFMANNPDIMPDLWEMDTQFNLFLAGAPSWLPGMGGPARARERIIDAVHEHHDALLRYLNGENPGDKWHDMSDVSSVIAERAKAFKAAGGSPRALGAGNGAIMWALNINSNPVVFWMIWYIFSNPTLLQEVRQEIAPYVRLQQPAPTNLPIKEPPKLDIDVTALWTKCPLLKGAFLETMRLEVSSMSYKIVENDFVVHEDERDAKLLGKKEPQSWLLRKGELICIPHAVHQTDEKYFRDAERFDPRRFWTAEDQVKKGENGHVKDAEHGDTEIKVEYKTMKPWGGGKQMCKGKTFAEREVVLFVGAIIMQWDIAPADNGGKWVHPGRIAGAAGNPKKDVRVRMRRREGW